MGWPSPLGGTIQVPPHPACPLESLVVSLTLSLTPFIQPNTTVALFRLPNFIALPLFFAVSRLQAIPVFLNDRYTLSDIASALSTLPITTLLTTNTDIKHHVSPTVPIVVEIEAHTSHPYKFSVTPTSSPNSKHPPSHQLPDQTAAVFFTSGTTSTPKPVPLTQHNLTVQSLSKIQYLPLSTSSVYLHLAPLYHLAGFSSALSATLAKATHIIPHRLHPSNPAHAAILLSIIREYAVSLLVAVPATLRLLLDAADHGILPSVCTVLYGGSAASDTLLSQLRLTFPNSQIIATYAMTETASTLTISRKPGPSLPLPHVQLAILKDTCEIVSSGRGEIVTKGPQVFPGYYGRGNEGFINGWFRTGDIGVLTQSGLTWIGRRVEMIKSGGEKVYAGEVESVLMAHSAVREAAVVGVPDRVLGEAVAACVVLDGDGGQQILTALRQFCRSALAHFKCPRWILETPALPRNATGKVVKTRVREILESNLKPRSKL